MICPVHAKIMEKVHLDRYYCPVCDHDWLIHPFKREKKGKKKEAPG